jgi:hypothetical protein
MECLRNKYLVGAVAGLSLGTLGAAYVDFFQYPLTADIEAPAIVFTSTATTSAQPVVSHPTLDGVEHVVTEPETSLVTFVTASSC